MRGATRAASVQPHRSIFQSTLLMRGATSSQIRRISSGRNFNPRSSCEERLQSGTIPSRNSVFQSTLLMRGATSAKCPPMLYNSNFNPRSSCEERRGSSKYVVCSNVISIHAPHARSDTIIIHVRFDVAVISIHAPHARSDRRTSRLSTITGNFNPRSSCEERPKATMIDRRMDLFQSTLLMRGATSDKQEKQDTTLISIHAPHARSDLTDKYPEAPSSTISIHAPHARSDNGMTELVNRNLISIHAPHARSDLSK